IMRTNLLEYMKKVSGWLFRMMLLVQLVGCMPDLDLINPQEISVDTYYQTPEQLEAAIIPAYQALIGRTQGGYARNLYYQLLAPGDDFTNTLNGSRCIRLPTIHQQVMVWQPVLGEIFGMAYLLQILPLIGLAIMRGKSKKNGETECWAKHISCAGYITCI